MSVIIGLKGDDGVYIAIDSQSSNDIKFIHSEANNMKARIIHKNPNIIIAHSGKVKSSAVHELLKDILLDDPKKVENFGYHFLIDEFIDAMQELENKHRLLNKEEFPKILEGDILIAFKNQLFVIQNGNGGMLLEANEFACGGSSMAVAVGSLESTRGIEPIKRLKLALNACRIHDSYVDQPFMIFHTYKIYYSKIELNKTYETIQFDVSEDGKWD